MIELHHYPGNASMAPHIALRELGVPFELKLVNRLQQQHKSPAYLKLNPNGLIPVLVDDGQVLYETAAILLHLADRHPQARLAPPVGSFERAHFYKWLVWLTNTLQVTLIHYFYPERLVDEGDEAAAAQVKRAAQRKAGTLLAQLDAEFDRHGGPWLLGADYSVADPMAFMLGRWTRGFQGGEAPPARQWPHLGPYLQRMLARPAVQAVLAAEGLAEPWI
jgi:glutathione S-transferase